jgi:hypothetical protein
LLERPRLPPAPAEFGAPVALPDAATGKPLSVFALENRRAAILANRRLSYDSEFYGGVLREFSSEEK